MALTQPTSCDNYYWVIQVDSVDSNEVIGTFTILEGDDDIYTGPHNFNIPQAECGFDVGDAVC